jgi:site-specific recombinase XerD
LVARRFVRSLARPGGNITGVGIRPRTHWQAAGNPPALRGRTLYRLIKRIGERADLPFQIHAHMLRYACGYAMANAGHDARLIQDWLGHRAIQHTARYTELSPVRFKDVWRTSVVR